MDNILDNYDPAAGDAVRRLSVQERVALGLCLFGRQCKHIDEFDEWQQTSLSKEYNRLCDILKAFTHYGEIPDAKSIREHLDTVIPGYEDVVVKEG